MAELLVSLRRDDGAPLHAQLEQELRAAVRSRRLKPGAAMPSTRALAAQLGVSRGVVVEAYEQLAAEGYLAPRAGGVTRVAPQAVASAAQATRAMEPPRPRIDFRPGRPDVSEFPRAAWLRSLRRALNEAPAERFSYWDGSGLPELREALAAYLNRVRGACADAERMVISNGFSQGLALVCAALRSSGARRVAVEDPAHQGSVATIRSAGLSPVGVPVDDDGLRVELLRETRVDAVLVTPAHQYPTGAVLPPHRRAGLVEWARRRGALIIEDDYDAEYRYDREPIGAIHGLAPDRVVYAGSASKTLAPGLRLGWLVVPGHLARAVADAKSAADGGSPALEQLAFADFVVRGELDRHLRRMRPIYRRRRDALLAALGAYLPHLRPTGSAAGLHVLAWLPPGIDEASLLRLAAERSVGIYGLAPHRLAPSDAGGLIFGYGTLSEGAITEGVRLLGSGA
ncbi:MAG TPA: PLP-dependent aminotransferase family protein [Candidatus Limnocylindria bacterium]|nr:PLP-dependent aminotransferase family protein [Candidatus Limnocylindria bacterium]